MIPISDILIDTLVRGAFYVLVSASLALLFGIISVASFMHGDMAMLGGYVAFFVLVSLNLNPVLAVVITGVVMFLVAAGLERTLLRPLRRISGKLWMFNTFVLTLGISQIMQNGGIVAFGPEFRGVAALWPGTVTILGVSFSIDRFIMLIASVGIMVLLWGFLKYTRLGRAIRATGINEEAVPLFGVNVNMIYMFTFGLSGLLAGVGGAFYMALFTTYPLMGVTPNLKAWIVVLIAGLGNVKGAVICSFLLALVETLAIYWLSAGWQNVIGTVIVILVLLFRPTGIFGTEVKGIWER
jgi:branched-chain amino acid transport system permease protein